jgi:hypothetical protein
VTQITTRRKENGSFFRNTQTYFLLHLGSIFRRQKVSSSIARLFCEHTKIQSVYLYEATLPKELIHANDLSTEMLNCNHEAT